MVVMHSVPPCESPPRDVPLELQLRITSTISFSLRGGECPYPSISNLTQRRKMSSTPELKQRPTVASNKPAAKRGDVTKHFSLEEVCAARGCALSFAVASVCLVPRYHTEGKRRQDS